VPAADGRDIEAAHERDHRDGDHGDGEDEEDDEGCDEHASSLAMTPTAHISWKDDILPPRG